MYFELVNDCTRVLTPPYAACISFLLHTFPFLRSHNDTPPYLVPSFPLSFFDRVYDLSCPLILCGPCRTPPLRYSVLATKLLQMVDNVLIACGSEACIINTPLPAKINKHLIHPAGRIWQMVRNWNTEFPRCQYRTLFRKHSLCECVFVWGFFFLNTIQWNTPHKTTLGYSYQ